MNQVIVTAIPGVNTGGDKISRGRPNTLSRGFDFPRLISQYPAWVIEFPGFEIYCQWIAGGSLRLISQKRLSIYGVDFRLASVLQGRCYPSATQVQGKFWPESSLPPMFDPHMWGYVFHKVSRKIISLPHQAINGLWNDPFLWLRDTTPWQWNDEGHGRLIFQRLPIRRYGTTCRVVFQPTDLPNFCAR